jgi:2-methylcitrate dehydratase PrpD
MSNLAQQISRHINHPHTIDAALQRQIDSLTLDYLGVTVGGINRLSAVAARNSVDLSESPNEFRPSRIFGCDSWATIDDAALVNGITSHGLELDDTHEQGSMHPGVAILPAVFAFADAHPTDKETFTRAVAVGYDIMTSVGVLVGADESYGRGFHPTGICGAMGAAASIAVLMGLSQLQAQNAVSLAANMSSGSLEFLSDGSWTKRLNAGNAAVTGIRAAKLARAGFEGPATFLEGRDGFLRQYGHGLVDGREFLLEFGAGAKATSIKFYPCCRYMHGNIDLIREIKAEHPELLASDVVRIECGVIRAGATLVADPPKRKMTVTSPVDAQFNMPFGAALAFSTGTATVAQFDGAEVLAKNLSELMHKVECYSSERLEAAFPEIWQAEVRVHLKDGTIIERFADAYKGSPNKPADGAEMLTKMGDLVSVEWAERMSSNLNAAETHRNYNSSVFFGI